MRLSVLFTAVAGVGLVCGGPVGAASVFSDDFNRNSLNEFGTVWVGKSGTTSDMNGLIVADPAGGSLPTSGVLTFGAVASGGDTFTSSGFTVIPGDAYVLSFDYYGKLPSATPNGDGGFIGLSDGFPNNHYWLAGTQVSEAKDYGLDIQATPDATLLEDTGTWKTYTIGFIPGAGVTSLHVLLEDFTANAGDAFFDNIQVESLTATPTTAVPTPASAAGGVLLLGGMVAFRRRNAIV